MQVKKFEAPTMQEALDNVKRELGPEAIILQTKQNRRGFGLLSKSSVEITAAVSDRSIQKKQLVESKLPDAGKVRMNSMPAKRQADIIEKYSNKNIEKKKSTADQVELSRKSNRITATRYIDIEDEQGQQYEKDTRVEAIVQSESSSKTSLEEEVKDLRKMFEELKKKESDSQVPINWKGAGAESFLRQTFLDTPVLQDAFEQLVIHGVDRKYAHALIKKVVFEIGLEQSGIAEQVFELLANEFMETVDVASLWSGIQTHESQAGGNPYLIALAGPTGVGKTMTIAKLASQAKIRQGYKVGLINIDHSKTSNFGQLGTYSKILNLPFRSLNSVDDLRAALVDFQNCDVVFIDTAGCSQKDPDSIKVIQTVLQSILEINVYLVLSATTRDIELYDAVSRFSVLGVKGIIFSKLDEASIYGSIYNVSQKVKLPLVYFTMGRKIPDDLEEATRERVAALVMNI